MLNKFKGEVFKFYGCIMPTLKKVITITVVINPLNIKVTILWQAPAKLNKIFMKS